MRAVVLLPLALAGCSQGSTFEVQPPGLLLQSGCLRTMTVDITDRTVRVTKGCIEAPSHEGSSQ